jgi:hypothetical protein
MEGLTMRLTWLAIVAAATPAIALATPADTAAPAPAPSAPAATAPDAKPAPAPKKKQVALNDDVQCHWEAPVGSLIQKKVCTTKQVRDQGHRDADDLLNNPRALTGLPQ